MQFRVNKYAAVSGWTEQEEESNGKKELQPVVAGGSDRERRRIERKEVEVEVCASGDSCLLRLVLYIYLSHNATLLRTHRTGLLRTLSDGTSENVRNELTVDNNH